MSKESTADDSSGSSPAGRGGAGVYIEGELGAFYLLAMLADSEPRGLPGTRLDRVSFQGAERGFALDDLIIEGASAAGRATLEIQSKRTIKFSSKDPIFNEVCEQIAATVVGKPERSHHVAVATQRTSHAISGPYQDVLEWARRADDGASFFARLDAKGVAGDAMRAFGKTFRENLVSAGVPDEDEATWRIIRRFQILEFDFESSAPMARTLAVILARLALSPDDADRAEALWTSLIAISIETAKAGGSLECEGLRQRLTGLGFRLAGDRHLEKSRATVAEQSRRALAEIGTTIADVALPRTAVVDDVNAALDRGRYVQIRGNGGVGKSSVLRTVAERLSGDGPILVLDPINTPEGGWGALALQLGVPSTAKEFLHDLAASGGGTLFIDSLEMFTSPAKRRTVNDLLREVSRIDGFSVVATTRLEFGDDGDDWLATDAVTRLGAPGIVTVPELRDDEVAALRAQAPELDALLDPDHPAAEIARNLYRLARLLKAPAATAIRTEAALAESWWKSGDNSPPQNLRGSQRLMADMADTAIAGADVMELREDSPARSHLLRSKTLSEGRRDRLGFYHGVLRDWAVGARLAEDPDIIATLDLTAPASQRVARGVEFAARLALESTIDCGKWRELLGRLSPEGSHGSWRRHALLAIVRSEISPELLERCTTTLVADGGAILIELLTAIVAVETSSPAELAKNLPADALKGGSIPKTLRLATTRSAPNLLAWCIRHAAEIPLNAIIPVVKLVEVAFFFVADVPAIGKPTAGMLFAWLLQLDVHGATVTIPRGDGPDRHVRGDRRRVVEELRTMALLLSAQAPDQLKSYLRSLAEENDHHKVKEIRPLSTAIARTAPQELADLIVASLVEPEDEDDDEPHRPSRDRALSFDDTDYLPPSPAQAPFLDLLEAAPDIGLTLVRRLVDESISFRSDGRDGGDSGITLEFPDGPRAFPWIQSYFWSRDQAREYSTASGLMALEAWGHGRIESGEDAATVIADVLGPVGSPAAFLLVAVDLLISHWSATRGLLVPFVGNPELLAIDRQRSIHDQTMGGRFSVGDEPAGRVRLADLQAKPSRGAPLEQLLPAYSDSDAESVRVRTLLDEAIARLGPYDDRADFGDPAFMGVHARNMADPANWKAVEGGRAFQPPHAEAEHVAKLAGRHAERFKVTEMEARISMATHDAKNGSPELAREAAVYVDGGLPDESEPDHGRTRSLRLVSTALLVARDGDDALLAEREPWVREVISLTLAEKGDRFTSRGLIDYNRPALATVALVHLLRRLGKTGDRNALISLASRDNRAAAIAFKAARTDIEAIDPRMIKSAVRVGIGASRWQWHPWDEPEEVREKYAEQKRAGDAANAAAEIEWLDGGAEPAWPSFPKAEPTLRRGSRIVLSPDSGGEGDEAPTVRKKPVPTIHGDSQSAALWLGLVTDTSPLPAWHTEIVDAYAAWSADENGLRHDAHAEVDREPREWNDQFYQLVATAMLEGSQQLFNELTAQVTGLPDRSFGDVSETLIHAADVWYFNGEKKDPCRPVALRETLVARAMQLSRWEAGPRPGDLSIDLHTGGVVAKLLMNTHDVFHRGNTSYLVPAVFDRIDPLLAPIQPMMPGGPTQFVALCTMNTLLVAPRARHLDFLLAALKDWHTALPTDASMWIGLGIGRLVMEWFEAAANEDPTILAKDHRVRGEIDVAVGRLVTLGVAQAHEFEMRVAAY